MRKTHATTRYISALLLGAASILYSAPLETPEAVYAKIGALLQAGHADKVAPFMTEQAHKEMVDATIEDAAEGFIFNKEDAKPLPDGTKALGVDLGFDEIEFPKWFSTKGGFPEPGFNMADFRKKLQALMDTVPDRDRALNSLHAFATAAYPNGSTFNGKIIDPPEGHEPTPGILWISFVEVYGTFNDPIRFEKQDNGEWLYAGYAWDIIRADKEKNRSALHEKLIIAGSSLDGEHLSLKDLKGKVVLVDFWGTWCGPCIAAFPHLKKLNEAYKQHGFEVLGVASDDKKNLRDFFQKKGPLPWPNILDADGTIVERLKIEAFPTYFLIDKDGKHIATPRDKEELGSLIAKALGIEPIPLKEVARKGAK